MKMKMRDVEAFKPINVSSSFTDSGIISMLPTVLVVAVVIDELFQ